MIGRAERWVSGCERRDLVRVLLGEYRAGDVGQPSARLHEAAGVGKDRLLLGDARLQLPAGQPPLGVRPPAPGAGARAGRVDQHEVELAAMGLELRRFREYLDVARLGAADALEDG